MRLISRAVLFLLVAALLLSAWTLDRSKWRSLLGDEATYLMAAESLAWDFDLEYERRDYERFVEHWQSPPEGLILQSGDSGGHITFGKPFFYPLVLAPFVRLAPLRGAQVANALLLILAAWVSVRALRRSLGDAAPLWVAVFLFGSIAFAYTYWAQADLLLLCATAVGLGLAFSDPDATAAADHTPVRFAADERRTGSVAARWAAVGALLALVIFSRPFYLPLLLPALLAVPRPRRRTAAVALVLGAAGLTLVAGLVHRANSGSWTAYGAERRGFYERIGFPEVDFPAEDWDRTMSELGNAAWAEARTPRRLPRTDASLWRWNGLYLLFGRNVGLLPYFLPIVLGLAAAGRRRWWLLLAVAVSTCGFLLYRPFNFYGGGAALANRYFMPLYPALWYLVARRRSVLWPVAVALLAAPFLWPTWTQPRADPLTPTLTYRYVSPAATRLLPFETTQSHLKPSGRRDLRHQGLWIRFLDPDLSAEPDWKRLYLKGDGRGELLIGRPQPLAAVELRLPAGLAGRITVGGGEVVEKGRDEAGLAILEVRFAGARARHPMWWTWNPVYLYSLTLEAEPGKERRIPFSLKPVRR